jgi:hypothetical protein
MRIIRGQWFYHPTSCYDAGKKWTLELLVAVLHPGLNWLMIESTLEHGFKLSG